jgi:Cellulase (glycosyl hydrolase family 5)
MNATRPRTAARATGTLAMFAALAFAAGSSAYGSSAGHADAAGTVPLVGVNIHDIEPSPLREADLEIGRAAALHATVVRSELAWSTFQPSSPTSTDPAAVAYLDRLVSDAGAHNIRVILLVDSSPCWASTAPAAVLRGCQRIHTRANGYPPRDPNEYAAFVAYLAQRYGTHLAAIEIWNEPDQANEQFFAGPEKAKRYAALLHAAYPAVKQASPNVTVIAGSLVGSNGVFLRALYAAGIKGYYDGLAVHYYTLTLASVRAIHAVQLANGDQAPLWLDEFGWTSCFPRLRIQAEQPCVTQAIQASDLRDVIHALSPISYIAAEVIYKLRDSPTENFGVLFHSGARKRSFGALAKVFASPFGPVSRVHLKLRRRSGRVLASGSGPVGDFMQLEAFKAGKLRYRATFVLDRFNRYSIRLPRVLGTRGLSVRVYQFWSGPARGAQRSI